MKYTIENNGVKITADTLGAELVEIKVNGKEKLWQNETGAWAGHAPLLFPICGRRTIVVDGKNYETGLHSFARKTEFSLVEQGKDYLVFELSANEKTKAEYPYDFHLQVRYQIIEQGVESSYIVKNTGEKDLYFSCGSHESFALDSDVDGYEIEFEQEENLVNLLHDDMGRLTGATTDYGAHKNFALPKEYLQEGRTLIFGDIASRFVKLNKITGETVAVFSFEYCKNLLIWRADGQSNYICIEPWGTLPETVGKTEELSSIKNIIKVANGETKTISRKIEYR
jgi:galactose mutarotase-like enzyme